MIDVAGVGKLLRRHVTRSAERYAGSRLKRGVLLTRYLRQSKVGELDLPAMG